MSQSGLDFSALSDLPKSQARGGWQPLQRSDLRDGMGLFFDQSLTNTGWVTIVVKNDMVRVLDAGMIKPVGDENLTGFRQDFARGTSLFEQILKDPRLSTHQGFDVVAAETPPIGFKVKGDGTSSKLAAQSIHTAYHVMNREVVLIQSQAAKKTMTGRGSKVTKKEAHDAMRLHCFPWISGTELVSNEHTRDALLNGLHWFAQEK